MNRQESLADRMINDVAGLNPADLEMDLRNTSETKPLISEPKLTSKNISVRMRRSVAAAMAVVALAGPMASETEAESLPPMMVDTAVETTPDIVTPEPTAEVKAAVTAAVEDPEAKVSVEDLKDIFESYRQRLFAPYKEELTNNGCVDEAKKGWEARIDWGSKILYAYDEGKDMRYQNTGDKFQDHMGESGRQDIVDYIKTGKSDKLEILCNEAGEPRILMVNSTQKITQGVVDSIQFFKDIGCTNIQEVLYDNGAVVYFCSESYGSRGSFSIIEYGIICSGMSAENTTDLTPTTIKKTNIASIYVESLGILQLQMRRSIDGMWDFGNFKGDVEVAKSFAAGYTYLGLYKKTGYNGFSVESEGLIGMGYGFGKDYNISPDDPRIQKQIALITVLSEPLNGINWDGIDEIKQMREEYLTT